MRRHVDSQSHSSLGYMTPTTTSSPPWDAPENFLLLVRERYAERILLRPRRVAARTSWTRVKG